MKCVIKLLLDVEAMDDPHARGIFKGLAQGITRAIGDTGQIRALKIVEDGQGRLIDNWSEEPSESP